MKLTLLTAALVAVLTMTCLPVQAQTNNMASGTNATSATMPMMKKTPYKGTITAVDTTKNTVTVQGAKATMTLMITPMTKYKGGTMLSDYAVGDKITGSFTKDDNGMMSACSIHKKMMKK